MASAERLWKAFTEPPQLGVQAAANRIEAELAEVRKEQELLLNKRVQHMEKRLDSLATTAKNQAISLATMTEDTAAIERKVDEIEAGE
jgi:uncharacterized protein YlxW (UPF0749 family)